MKKIFVIVFLFSGTISVFAQGEEDFPILRNVGESPESFIPEGWKLLALTQGDLNKDGIDDAVFVMEENNPDKIVKNSEVCGAATLNFNPRGIVLLLRQDAKYVLAVHNFNFIPTRDTNSDEAPYDADPFEKNEGILIENGVLNVNFHFWSKCWGNYDSKQTFKFRYQEDDFRLIGYERDGYELSTGKAHNISVNYLTGKMSQTYGGNKFDSKSDKPETKWFTLSRNEPMTIGQIYDANYFEAF